MIVLAFLGYRYIETKDDPCGRILTSNDSACEAAAAAERLARGYRY
ncbi:hypothetical protein AB5I41_04570 [Sphingomonas sp. MMS24-JH45]